MTFRFDDPESVMRHAVELAQRGEGRVEPNPMVGAVVVDAGLNRLGEGWHEAFGGAHAERNALREAGDRARGATLYVTLEPCCHHGKTPPCVDALIEAGISRVVVGRVDPSPHAGGQGLAALRNAGIDVEVGLLSEEAARLTAPFARLVESGRPYVHAKWAMTLDGKIATRRGDSQWISNETSRARVHRLRGRMDAIVVGSGTAAADDPLLTARPRGARTPARIVVDSRAVLSVESRLVRSLSEAPVIVATSAGDDDANAVRLSQAGVEVLRCPGRPALGGPAGGHDPVDLKALFAELGRRQMTNVLVEGGARLLGGMFDDGLVDYVHVFVAPAIAGGAEAPTAVAGRGCELISRAARFDRPQVEILDGDVYLHGPLRVDAP